MGLVAGPKLKRHWHLQYCTSARVRMGLVPLSSEGVAQRVWLHRDGGGCVELGLLQNITTCRTLAVAASRLQLCVPLLAGIQGVVVAGQTPCASCVTLVLPSL